MGAGSFFKAFSDTFNVLFSLKLVFFLPLYFFYYLFLKNHRITTWMDSKHLIINAISLSILGALLAPFVFSSYGILISVICLIIATLNTIIFRPFWNRIMTRYPFINPLQGTLN
jgi:hypothetical protein